jgi:hypothetical protein
MKSKIQALFVVLALLQLAHFQCSTAQAQGTTFTYQGRLNANGAPANGVYDFSFGLFSTSSGGTLIGSADSVPGVSVTNGLFTVALDFGANFPGAARWLEISVRTNGGAVFTTLVPRQPLTPTPYAITAGSLVGGGLPAVYTNVVSFNNTNNNFNGSFTGTGSGLTGLWKIGGNAGTTNDFIGTTDNTTFNIEVNNVRAMQYDLDTDLGGVWTNAPNVIGGSSINLVYSGTVGATIGGGGGIDSPGGGFPSPNRVSADFGTVSGGLGNTASYLSTVSGGGNNMCGGNNATISGGYENTAGANYASVGGGTQNNASGADSRIGGGYNNTASGVYASVGGGYHNTAGGDYSTIGGGWQNIANGDYSFAGGYYAHAQHNGSFVWSDTALAAPFSSTTANQFRVRATGGAAFATAVDVNANVTAGVHVLSGDTAWSSISDRNAKKNFQPVDSQAILEKLAAMPVQSWNYKWESDTNTLHIGPMAQDFKAAFYPGRDDKSISTLEFDGVELAAIQGLNQKIEEQKMDLNSRDARISALEKEILELKAAVKKLSNKRN